MRIDVKGRKVAVSDELRERVERRFEKIAKQVSPLARLEMEISEDRIPGTHVAEAALHVKGTTLRARETGSTVLQAVNQCADDLARQVKRRKEKLQHRRPSQAAPRPAEA